MGNPFEGHPDNVAPAILGGVVVATYDHHTQEVLTVHKNVEAPIAMVAVIPNVQLSTKKSRGVLPSSLAYGEAVEASSRSNVLVAGLMVEDWKVISSIVEKIYSMKHIVPRLFLGWKRFVRLQKERP